MTAASVVPGSADGEPGGTVSPVSERRLEFDRLAERLVASSECWSPTLTAHGHHLAYVSNGTGVPSLWVQDTEVDDAATGNMAEPHLVALGDDPVLRAHWSPDGQWLACSVAPGGGVHTEVWVVRPDGTDARRVTSEGSHAELGPWAPRGHQLTVTVCERSSGINRCVLVDPEKDTSVELAQGALLHLLDISEDERFLLLRDGPRGAEQCWLLDRQTGHAESLLPFPSTGSTQSGILRPGREEGVRLMAYLVTDAGLPRRGLVAVPLGDDGSRRPAGAIAQRPDAELDLVDADRERGSLLLVWNVGGTSEVELLETSGHERRRIDGLPGTVAGGAVMSRDGSRAVLSVEGPLQPRQLFELWVDTGSWSPITGSNFDGGDLVLPTLERFASHDGLEIEGWLYPAYGTAKGWKVDRQPPAVIYLHGGPEAQERPAFSPQHQLLAAAGITVFAPNIRGSAGYGRSFVHADDRYGRASAIGDVAFAAKFLVERHLADERRVAVAGRSYGGYATLMALAFYPEIFAAGVDICGMSNLLTFYRDTDPWTGKAAVRKYGDPERDQLLLNRMSPLRHLHKIRAPLLVIHGELDTNVPINESHQLVTALQAEGRHVSYVELPGEGHEYRRRQSRLRVLRAVLGFLDETLAPSSSDQ
jgi:dipeptidyl aminopeptidase/acylaminoacyl peptidase